LVEDKINYTLDNLIPDKFKNHLLSPGACPPQWHCYGGWRRGFILLDREYYLTG
jgi:hypothetical protein